MLVQADLKRLKALFTEMHVGNLRIKLLSSHQPMQGSLKHVQSQALTFW